MTSRLLLIGFGALRGRGCALTSGGPPLDARHLARGGLRPGQGQPTLRLRTRTPRPSGSHRAARRRGRALLLTPAVLRLVHDRAARRRGRAPRTLSATRAPSDATSTPSR